MERYPIIGNVNGLQVGKSIELKNAVLFLKTHTSGVKHTQEACDTFMIMKFSDGNISWNINEEVNYERDRRKLDDVSAGDEQPLEVSFAGKSTFVQSNSDEPATIHEIIKGRNFSTGGWKFGGTAEEWLTRYGCPPYACELELQIIPQLECPLLEAEGEAYLFRYFRAPSVGWDASSKRVDVRGSCDILIPLVKRVDYTALYDFTVPGGVKVGDLEPLQDVAGADFWPADPREQPYGT